MIVDPAPGIAIVVVAAGAGTRLGLGVPKAFVELDGQPVLWHALRGVFAGPPAQVVVVAPADRIDHARRIAAEHAGERTDPLIVVPGGSTRQQSVAAGLAVLADRVRTVLVHDAARALAPPELFERVASAVAAGAEAVIPVLPVIDTLKRVDGSTVTESVDRSALASAQTPQGFARDVLLTAYAGADEDFTDDAALVAAAGHTVSTVPGAATAFKITTMADLKRAHSVTSPRSVPPVPRIGIGTDVHAYGGEGALWLAGVEWPGERPLTGHSDGDAVAHAIVDAVLSAAGLGDIGTLFGTDDPDLAGAHAETFLRRAASEVHAAGWRIGNVAVQVQANRPKLSARRAEAEEVLSAALGAPVSLSATTTDGLGFTGRGDGIAAFAVAQLLPR